MATFLTSPVIECPLMEADPLVTNASPDNILNMDVLPAPLRPRRPKHSP